MSQVMDHEVGLRQCGPTFFRWSRRSADGVVVVSLAGELDLAALELEPVLLGLAESDHAATIVLDLSQLEFIDACGVSVILSAWKAARARGHVLRVEGLHGLPARVFGLLGLEPMLDRQPCGDVSEGDCGDQW